MALSPKVKLAIILVVGLVLLAGAAVAAFMPGIFSKKAAAGAIGEATTSATCADCTCRGAAAGEENCATCAMSELDPYTAVSGTLSTAPSLYRVALTTATSVTLTDAVLGISGKNTLAGPSATQTITGYTSSGTSTSYTVTGTVRKVLSSTGTAHLLIVSFPATVVTYYGRAVNGTTTSYPKFTANSFLPTGSGSTADATVASQGVTASSITIFGVVGSFQFPSLESGRTPLVPTPIYAVGFGAGYACTDYYKLLATATPGSGKQIAMPLLTTNDAGFATNGVVWHQNVYSAYASYQTYTTDSATPVVYTTQGDASWPAFSSAAVSTPSPVRYAGVGDSVLVYVQGGDTSWGLQLVVGGARPSGATSKTATMYLGPMFVSSTYNTNVATGVYRADDYATLTGVYTLSSTSLVAANVTRYDVPTTRDGDSYTPTYATFALAQAAVAAASGDKVFAFRVQLPDLALA